MIEKVTRPIRKYGRARKEVHELFSLVVMLAEFAAIGSVANEVTHYALAGIVGGWEILVHLLED